MEPNLALLLVLFAAVIGMLTVSMIVRRTPERKPRPEDRPRKTIRHGGGFG